VVVTRASYRIVSNRMEGNARFARGAAEHARSRRKLLRVSCDLREHQPPD